MKAMVIDRFGGSDEFRLANLPVPRPGPGQVLIRVAYASVNPADWKGRAGMLPHLGHYPFPITIGMDCAGVVTAVGRGVTGFRPDDRVISLSGMGLGLQGTYAEYVVVPEPRVAPLPAHLDFAAGATIPIASASAASSIIDVAKAKVGDAVFVNGGAGSVGTFAIQFLKHLGAHVVATCSTRNVHHVRGLGADLVIDYLREDIAAGLAQWAPDGLDAVIDAVGQHSLPRDMPRLIRPGGTLVCIQNLITGVEDFDLDLAAARNVRVVDNVADAMTEDPTWFQVHAFRQLLDAIVQRRVSVPPYEIVPLEQAGAAHDRVQQGHVGGKILLKIADL
ncbi:quinone oxidoreductase family protein [Flavisphingomonas formosensis]|uniref:quinone oxidoreductase family protein n=1 Tax=Flavisphingomonas formosensis TaxID=861534 RepID=UPI0018DF7789|nr:NADP-dependent oxidoreductase [Sphingomonas formosensis]